MPITFEMYICVPIHKVNAYEVLVSHKYFTFDNHICSFVPMTTYVFLVWQTFFCFVFCTYANTFELVHPCVSAKMCMHMQW